MKFNVKKFSIILVCIIVVSFAASGLILYFTGGVSALSVGQHQLIYSREFEMEGVKSIIVKTVNARVSIIPVTVAEHKIRADFYGNVSTNLGNLQPELSAELINGVLNIEITYPKTINIGLINIERLYLDVYVPSDYAESMKVQTVSSCVNIRKFNLDVLAMSSVSGCLTAENVETESFTARTTSGKVELKEVSGQLDIATISGEVSVILSRLDKNLKVGTVSGKTSVIIPEDAFFDFELRTVSGSMTNQFGAVLDCADRKNIKGSVGEGASKIFIETTSGSIELLKK